MDILVYMCLIFIFYNMFQEKINMKKLIVICIVLFISLMCLIPEDQIYNSYETDYLNNMRFTKIVEVTEIITKSKYGSNMTKETKYVITILQK